MHFYFQTQKTSVFVQNHNPTFSLQQLLQTNYSLPANSANKTPCHSPKIDDSLRDVIYEGSQREDCLQFQDSFKKDKNSCDKNSSTFSDSGRSKIGSDNCETDTNPICNLTVRDKQNLVLKQAKTDLPVWSKDTNVSQETEVEILQGDSALYSTSGSKNTSHCADKKCAELQNTEPMTISTSKENCYSIEVTLRPDLEVQVEICTDEPVSAPPTHSDEDVVSKFTDPKFVGKFTDPKFFDQISNPQVVSEIDPQVDKITNPQVDKITNPQVVDKITNSEVLGKMTSIKVSGKTIDPKIVSKITSLESVEKLENPKVVGNFTSIESVDNITNPEVMTKIANLEVVSNFTSIESVDKITNPEVITKITSLESVEKLENPKVVGNFTGIESVDKITNVESIGKLSNPEVVTKIANLEVVGKITNLEIVDKITNPEVVTKIANPEVVAIIGNSDTPLTTSDVLNSVISKNNSDTLNSVISENKVSGESTMTCSNRQNDSAVSMSADEESQYAPDSIRYFEKLVRDH